MCPLNWPELDNATQQNGHWYFLGLVRLALSEFGVLLLSCRMGELLPIIASMEKEFEIMVLVLVCVCVCVLCVVCCVCGVGEEWDNKAALVVIRHAGWLDGWLAAGWLAGWLAKRKQTQIEGARGEEEEDARTLFGT